MLVDDRLAVAAAQHGCARNGDALDLLACGRQDGQELADPQALGSPSIAKCTGIAWLRSVRPAPWKVRLSVLAFPVRAVAACASGRG